jgi:tetratricopeptide (TPR) repeat protein
MRWLMRLKRAIVVDTHIPLTSQDLRQNQSAVPRAGDFRHDCDAAVRVASGEAIGLGMRGFVHLMLRQPDDAVADFDAALKIDPKAAAALYGRGLARRQKGDAAGGEADMAAAKAILPDIAERFAGYGVK